MKKIIIMLLIGSLFAQNNPNTSANEVDNPCEDKIFLELKEKKLDDMTDREYDYFSKKSTECATYQNTNRAMQSTDNIMAQSKTWTTYYIIISVVGLLITLSMMP